MKHKIIVTGGVLGFLAAIAGMFGIPSFAGILFPLFLGGFFEKIILSLLDRLEMDGLAAILPLIILMTLTGVIYGFIVSKVYSLVKEKRERKV